MAEADTMRPKNFLGAWKMDLEIFHGPHNCEGNGTQIELGSGVIPKHI